MKAEGLPGLIDSADAIVVLEEPRQESAVLFKSSNRRDLDALKASLVVEPPKEFVHCMCDGTPAIYLYANGKEIGQITNHHAQLIRCNLWGSDAKILNAEVFLKWFDDREIAGPRHEYEAALARELQWIADSRKWTDAMPSSLKPLWPAVLQSNDASPLRTPLAEQFSEKDERILALLSWYGSGAGPWSGYPAYEDIVAQMLLDYSTTELLTAVQAGELSAAQTEGVARLFAGWTFSRLRPNDLKLLSTDLKQRLLSHSLETENEDKRGRAQYAFGEN